MSTDVQVRLTGWCDRLLDGTVAVLASWTVLFHLARWTGMSRDLTLAVWLVVFLIGVLAIRRFQTGEFDLEAPSVTGRPANGPLTWLAVAGGLAGAAACAWFDLGGLWWPVAWVGLVGALVLAVRVAWQVRPRTVPSALIKALSPTLSSEFTGVFINSIRETD